jgi:hypothetical protein
MPVAIVVQVLMANHLDLLNRGCAFLPPIFTLAIGEKYVISKRTRKKKLLQENKKPTFSNIQVFNPVMLEENKSLLI